MKQNDKNLSLSKSISSKKSAKNNKYNYKLINFNINTECNFLEKKTNRPRQENSLDELTRKFFKYMKSSNSNIININDIVEHLHVQKRRIYDITNVLEGKEKIN